jgi:hypothetical protein
MLFCMDMKVGLPHKGRIQTEVFDNNVLKGMF